MTPDLDQLADEAIHALTAHMVAGTPAPDPDTEVARRSLRVADWRRDHPALDALAVARQTSLARLEARGITPDPGCTATSGRVTLEAVQDIPPLTHRYLVVRNREIVGVAWLSTDRETRGLYVATGPGMPGHGHGQTLREALQGLADLADTVGRLLRAASAGEIT